MEYIALIFIFIFSSLFAHFLIKQNIRSALKILLNIVGLIIFFFLVLLSGVKETSLTIYIFLILMTILGIIMRLVTPFVLNFVGFIFAKITKQEYKWTNYSQLFEADQSNKMYFCVLSFVTLKLILYSMLTLSIINLI